MGGEEKDHQRRSVKDMDKAKARVGGCLLYTSDAADEERLV